MLGVSDADQKLVKRILKRNIPNYKVLAFGSRVNGILLKKFSDLDLAIVSKERVKNLTVLKEDFTESNLPFRVDVLELNFVSPEFREIVLSDYEVVQEGGE